MIRMLKAVPYQLHMNVLDRVSRVEVFMQERPWCLELFGSVLESWRSASACRIERQLEHFTRLMSRWKLPACIEREIRQSISPPHTHTMANFFDIRARQKEAAANASSSKTQAQPEKNKLQPWVEK